MEINCVEKISRGDLIKDFYVLLVFIVKFIDIDCLLRVRYRGVLVGLDLLVRDVGVLDEEVILYEGDKDDDEV